MATLRSLAVRAAPRVGHHVAARNPFDEQQRPLLPLQPPTPPTPPWLPTASGERELLLARAQYRAWRQGDADASPVPRPASSSKKPPLHTDAVYQLLLDDWRPATARLEDDFHMDELLGVGGFGVVRAATSRVDGERYAIKAVHGTTALEREAALGEARVMAALPRHRSLVGFVASWLAPGPPPPCLSGAVGAGSTLTATRRDQSLESDGGSSVSSGEPADAAQHRPATLFLQMELCATPNLAEILASEAPPSAQPTAAARVRWGWLEAAADGLDAMHAAGFAHHDVKPANLLCYADGRAKLADFGLASRVAPSSLGLGVVAAAAAGCKSRGGTPSYMAPERLAPPSSAAAAASSHQLEGADSSGGRAGDVYALGVCLAELAGGFGTAMERAVTVQKLRGAADPGVELPLMSESTPLARSMLRDAPGDRPSAAQVRDAARLSRATEAMCETAASSPR